MLNTEKCWNGKNSSLVHMWAKMSGYWQTEMCSHCIIIVEFHTQYHIVVTIVMYLELSHDIQTERSLTCEWHVHNARQWGRELMYGGSPDTQDSWREPPSPRTDTNTQSINQSTYQSATSTKPSVVASHQLWCQMLNPEYSTHLVFISHPSSNLTCMLVPTTHTCRVSCLHLQQTAIMLTRFC